jgi:hypothetical protein
MDGGASAPTRPSSNSRSAGANWPSVSVLRSSNSSKTNAQNRPAPITESVQIGGHAHPNAVALCGSCVSVCAAAAPVSLAGVKPRAITKASPINAPTAAPRASNSSNSA